MGKFKVSFTTALFVFSFLICVIVAVAFVDRSPRNDYDSFYDNEKSANRDRDSESGESNSRADDEWNSRKQVKAPPAVTPAAEPAGLADLPIDPHLASAAQPVPGIPAAPAQTANPMAGRSPEDIARALMNKGMPAMPSPTPPGMAVPAGISMPATATPATVPAAPRPTSSYLPMQSNASGTAPGMPSASRGSFPSPGNYQSSLSNIANPGSSLSPPPNLSTSNASGSWNPVSAESTPSNMVGVRSTAGAGDSGMMISRGKTENDAAPPPGFTNGITEDGAATPFSGSGSSVQPPSLSATSPALPGSSPAGQQPFLLAPMQPSSSSNKWNLPPAPTLSPPIRDPDQRRSDAESGATNEQTPGSETENGSSGQALVVSEGTPVSKADPDQPRKLAARVNDVELTEDQAVKLAEANALVTKKPLTEDNRKDQINEAVKRWTAITAAAEQARADKVELPAGEVDKFAAMHPDLDLEQWKKSLGEAGFSKQEIDERLSDLALSEKLVAHELEQKYSDKDLKKVYDKTPKAFNSPRQVHVMEIFKARPEDEDRAKKVAGEMRRLQRQAASGTDFGLLARQASEAENKSKGGDRGWVTPDLDSDEKIAKTVATLKSGEVSPVVEGEDGYRILKVTEEKPARDDFEGGKELVIDKLKKELREETYADARKEQKVELSPKVTLISAKTEKSKVKGDKGADNKSDKSDESKADAADEAAIAAMARPAVRDKGPEPGEEIKQKPLPAKATPASVASSPTTQAFATAPQSQIQYGANGQPVQQIAGGQPAPASQAGGQTPAPVQGMGYRPGATITVGGGASNTLNPAQSTTVNYPGNTSVQSNLPAGQLQPADQALMMEARAMQAKAEQDEAAKQRAIDMQVQQARAGQSVQPVQNMPQAGGLTMTAKVGPRGSVQVPVPDQAQAHVASGLTAVSQTPLLNGQSAGPAAAQQTPQISESNGWTVTKTTHERNSPVNASKTADSGAGVPPGFGGSPMDQAGAQQAQQPQQGNTEEKPREGGIVNGVKSFFTGFRR